MKRSKFERDFLSIYILFSLIFTGFIGLLIYNSVIDYGPVEATTIYVDKAGGAHYTSIQAAVDNANDGDTIIVANGTYYESVTIYKNNITLIGNSSADCKIIHSYSGTNYLMPPDQPQVAVREQQNGIQPASRKLIKSAAANPVDGMRRALLELALA